MCSFISLIIQFIIYCCQVRCKNNLLPVIIYKNTGTKRDLPMKTFHHRDTQQCTEDWLSSDTAEIWHMTLLNCSLLVFSVLSGNKEMVKPKDFFSHPHTHFFSDKHKYAHNKSSRAQGWFICRLQEVVGEFFAAVLLSESVSNVHVSVCMHRKENGEEMEVCLCIHSMWVSYIGK